MTTEASPVRAYPSPLGAVGGAVALWAALCAVAATQAGALIGYFMGFGVAMLSIPLMLMGLGALMPVLIMGGLGLSVIIGAVYMIAGFRSEKFRFLATRGVHFIGCSAAVLLCMRSVERAF